MHLAATELPPEYRSSERQIVVVIGAGPAGLVTCKTLLEAATAEFPFEPIILEQEGDIGGTFRYRSYEVRNKLSIIHSRVQIRHRIPTWSQANN